MVNMAPSGGDLTCQIGSRHLAQQVDNDEETVADETMLDDNHPPGVQAMSAAQTEKLKDIVPSPVKQLPPLATLGLPPARVNTTGGTHASRPSDQPRLASLGQAHHRHHHRHHHHHHPAPDPAVRTAFEDAKQSLLRLNQLDSQHAGLIVKAQPEYHRLMAELGRLQHALSYQVSNSNRLLTEDTELRQENNKLKVQGQRMVNARIEDVKNYKKRIEVLRKTRKGMDATRAEAEPVLRRELDRLQGVVPELKEKVFDLRMKLEEEVRARREAEDVLEEMRKQKEEA